MECAEAANGEEENEQDEQGEQDEHDEHDDEYDNGGGYHSDGSNATNFTLEVHGQPHPDETEMNGAPCGASTNSRANQEQREAAAATGAASPSKKAPAAAATAVASATGAGADVLGPSTVAVASVDADFAADQKKCEEWNDGNDTDLQHLVEMGYNWQKAKACYLDADLDVERAAAMLSSAMEDAEPPKKKGRGRPPKNTPKDESGTAKKKPAKATPKAMDRSNDPDAPAESASRSSTTSPRLTTTRRAGRKRI